MTKDIDKIQDAFDKIPEEKLEGRDKKFSEENVKSLFERHSELELQLKEDIFKWTQKVVKYYLIFVGVLISFVAIRIPLVSEYVSIDLTDGVVITLLATTTATIVGLVALIITSLFPKDQKDKQKTN